MIPPTPNRVPLDVAFLRAKLAGDEDALAKLKGQARLLDEGKGACPECGDEGPHDDNGETRLSRLAFCCRACGTHWDFEGTS